MLVATTLVSPIALVSANPTTTLAAPTIVDRTMGPGSAFYINITIANVSAMWGYMLNLSYNTKILTVTGYDYYVPFILSEPCEINDTAGYVSVAYHMTFGVSEGFSTVDPVPIARIDFTVDAKGWSLLDLHDTVLSDIYGVMIAHDVIDGFFSNTRVHPPDSSSTSDTTSQNSPEPSYTTESQNSSRWYAGVLLNETYSATGTSASVHIYKNFINSSSDFAAFHIVVQRWRLWGGQPIDREFLEVGFYQNRSSFYLYAASVPPAQGEKVVYSITHHLTDHSLEIVEVSSETFEARIDSVLVKTVTFSSGLEPERFYTAEGESTNQGNNSLRGHFWNLKWYDSEGVPHDWQQREPYQDDPYRVGFPDGATNEFYTYGGGVQGDVNGDGTVNILDDGELSAHWSFPAGPKGYDSNSDIFPEVQEDGIPKVWDPETEQWIPHPSFGAVDIFDAAMVSAHWQESA